MSKSSSFKSKIFGVGFSLSNSYNAKTIGKLVDEAYSKQPVGVLFIFSMASKIKAIPVFLLQTFKTEFYAI